MSSSSSNLSLVSEFGIISWFFTGQYKPFSVMEWQLRDVSDTQRFSSWCEVLSDDSVTAVGICCHGNRRLCLEPPFFFFLYWRIWRSFKLRIPYEAICATVHYMLNMHFVIGLLSVMCIQRRFREECKVAYFGDAHIQHIFLLHVFFLLENCTLKTRQWRRIIWRS